MKPAALCAAPAMPLFASHAEIGHPARALAPATAPDRACAPAPRGHICGECSAPLARAHGKRNMFCSRACQTAFGNRMTVRGRVLAPLAMVDHLTRHGMRGQPEHRAAAKDACRQLRQQIERYAAEDRAAGRMTAVEYVARRARLGYADR